MYLTAIKHLIVIAETVSLREHHKMLCLQRQIHNSPILPKPGGRMIEILGTIEGINYREIVDPQEQEEHLVYIGTIHGISMVKKRVQLSDQAVAQSYT